MPQIMWESQRRVQRGLPWSVFTNIPASLDQNKSDRLRDALVQRTTTKHTTAGSGDGGREGETV